MNKNQLTVTWHGHSCFTVSKDEYSIVFDPYSPGSVPGLPDLNLTADQVLCSHGHRDHTCPEAVSLMDSCKKNPFDILKIDTWHDDQKGALRGENRIHILETDGLRIAHMGDIGCMLSVVQLEQLKRLDVIMIPVGGYYTIDAVQAKEITDLLSPRIVIPMHYRTDTFGYPVIGRLEEYTRLCNDVVAYDSNTLIINENTKPQTAVLKPF